jgi:hypothetical protein
MCCSIDLSTLFQKEGPDIAICILWCFVWLFDVWYKKIVIALLHCFSHLGSHIADFVRSLCYGHDVTDLKTGGSGTQFKFHGVNLLISNHEWHSSIAVVWIFSSQSSCYLNRIFFSVWSYSIGVYRISWCQHSGLILWNRSNFIHLTVVSNLLKFTKMACIIWSSKTFTNFYSIPCLRTILAGND